MKLSRKRALLGEGVNLYICRTEFNYSVVKMDFYSKEVGLGKVLVENPFPSECPAWDRISHAENSCRTLANQSLIPMTRTAEWGICSSLTIDDTATKTNHRVTLKGNLIELIAQETDMISTQDALRCLGNQVFFGEDEIVPMPNPLWAKWSGHFRMYYPILVPGNNDGVQFVARWICSLVNERETPEDVDYIIPEPRTIEQAQEVYAMWHEAQYLYLQNAIDSIISEDDKYATYTTTLVWPSVILPGTHADDYLYFEGQKRYAGIDLTKAKFFFKQTYHNQFGVSCFVHESVLHEMIEYFMDIYHVKLVHYLRSSHAH